jgi:hypothetical protein
MNEHTEAARLRKAQRIVEEFGPWVKEGTQGLLGPDAYAGLAMLMSERAWMEIAARAGVTLPSKATQAVVIRLLDPRPAFRPPADPLEGLPQ